jgi:hypothetical protein
MAGCACSPCGVASNGQTTFDEIAGQTLMGALEPAADHGPSCAAADRGIPKMVASGLCQKLEQVAD